MASSSSLCARPLNRGAACLPCRKLKAKCDGNKPACSRCITNSRPDDCEYATGAEVTRSRLLEENIALLEARIRELENPNESTPSVQLHDPRGRGSTASTSVPAIPLYPVAGALPAATADPSPQEAQMLVQTFMTHASQLGFFLNPTRFMRRQNNGPGTEALVASVYLWGSKLSSSSMLRACETTFMDRATQAALACQTTPPAAHTVLHMLQAEVLLANYFFSNNRVLEGRYHAIAAVALATGSRLHLLDPRNLGTDTIAAGERIQAFWIVAAMDKSWAAMMNTPSYIQCHNGRANIHAYEQGILLQPNAMYTVIDYVRGHVDDSGEAFSPHATRIKACAIYDHAVYVTSQFRPDMPDRDGFMVRYQAADALVQRVHGALVALRPRTPDDRREVLVSRTFLCAAAIQLHAPFASAQPAAWQRSICAATAAARALEIVDLNQTPHLDPVVAILWTHICRTLVSEMRRVRRGAAPILAADERRVATSLEKIMSSMTLLSLTSALMASQLAEIQQLASTM
ncbi:uncharacterized protein BXZ73DRAFT_92090 [Epithele typhae]|uniref:uncharacterized protein n=1 Tax=Epithele typhae TaxID=378194 RepID=UPI002007740B|nr:uncharacterized protein BXZ73DRAFT_92090 [Epithele typhae]KAH9919498.1 hypothetical protein BXZ73DRAFT_92090 [Epithele typhae]